MGKLINKRTISNKGASVLCRWTTRRTRPNNIGLIYHLLLLLLYWAT